MEKSTDITNFIGVYDNYITKEECNKAIQIFEDQKKFNQTLDRIKAENISVLQKQDNHCYVDPGNLELWWEQLKTLILNYDLAFKHYIKHTGAHSAYDMLDFKYTSIKIQKTLPTEGYHVWHIEHGLGVQCSNRAFAFSVYLNDVEEGGETEFLHFSKRVKPKTGRIVIWPASFPYLHRGNPPISGEKYMLTSWMILPYQVMNK